MTFIRACAVSDLESGEILKLDTDPAIAIYNIAGEFFATADTCTHGASSLSEGYLDEGQGEVECAWHMAKFCVRTGRARSLPATKPLVTYEIRVEDGVVLVATEPRAISRVE